MCDVLQSLNIHDPHMNQWAYLCSILISWLSNATNMLLYLHVPKLIAGQLQTSVFSHARRRGDLGRLLQFRTDTLLFILSNFLQLAHFPFRPSLANKLQPVKTNSLGLSISLLHV